MLASGQSCHVPESVSAKMERMHPVERGKPITLYYQGSGDQPVYLGEIQPEGCAEPHRPVWTFHVETGVDENPVMLTVIRRHSTEGVVQVRIGERAMEAALPVLMQPKELDKSCTGALGESRITITRNTRLLIRFTQAIRTLVPFCPKPGQGEDRWICPLPVIDPWSAIQEFGRLQKRMIRRWSRHPYLLARRLHIGLQLAGVLQSGSTDRHRHLCQILGWSLPDELPLAMRSPIWQERFCQEEMSPAGRRLALAGLRDVNREIVSLAEHLEEQSRLGVLSIKIPRSTAPSRDLWVRLRPAQIPETGDEPSNAAQNPCWHPYLSTAPGFLETARRLGLLDQHVPAACRHRFRPVAGLNPDQYLHDSIASESEFPITNGRGKLLRLPAGRYDYSLHQRSVRDLSAPFAPDSPETSGTLNWLARRPAPTIRKW